MFSLVRVFCLLTCKLNTFYIEVCMLVITNHGNYGINDAMEISMKDLLGYSKCTSKLLSAPCESITL